MGLAYRTVVTIAELLDVLWRDYTASAPQAEHIRYLLAARGEILSNDHIALCSYGAAGIDAQALARPFEALGWRPREHCEFLGPHLRAWTWQHDDDALPRVLIGEIAIDELSPAAQAVIGRMIRELPPGFGERDDLPWAGRPWRVTLAEYQALLAESEHAAWLAAFGFRVHHFTIDVGALSTFPDLEALDAFLIEHGFQLDDRGGAIKGSAAEWIEQSVMRPDHVAVELGDGVVRIPSGGYQLVRRYRLPSGELFPGVAPASAGAVFASVFASPSASPATGG
jgi:hypothetical protein